MNTATQSTAREVRISSGEAWLYGDLVTPPGFAGLVLFAHGSGSGRHSARNRQVAQRLQQAGIATLLFDLLTVQEEQVDLQTREHRFDIPLLTRRMQDATEWAVVPAGIAARSHRLLRREHGQRRRHHCRGAAGRSHQGRGVQGRPSRSCGSGRAGGGQGADAVDRWRGRPRRDRTQSRRPCNACNARRNSSSFLARPTCSRSAARSKKWRRRRLRGSSGTW